MGEPITSQDFTLLSLSQFAFLHFLRPGPQSTSKCQDPITVGSLMRLGLVAWHEPAAQRRSRCNLSTFSLTNAAIELLALHDGAAAG